MQDSGPPGAGLDTPELIVSVKCKHCLCKLFCNNRSIIMFYSVVDCIAVVQVLEPWIKLIEIPGLNKC